MLEANCTRCGETFIPHGTDPEDLIHCYRDGTDQECGGIGEITGRYGVDAPAMDRTLTPQEQHGRDMPDCAERFCEFHHPELGDNS